MKWERTRETMRLPSFHDGDSSHFTFRLEQQCNGLLYLLTCAGLTTDDDDDDDAIIHTILLSLLLHV
jgi:hypothetical protein